MADINIHNTSKLEMSEIIRLNEQTSIRRIHIESSESKIEITLFADSEDKLKVDVKEVKKI